MNFTYFKSRLNNRLYLLHFQILNTLNFNQEDFLFQRIFIAFLLQSNSMEPSPGKHVPFVCASMMAHFLNDMILCCSIDFRNQWLHYPHLFKLGFVKVKAVYSIHISNLLIYKYLKVILWGSLRQVSCFLPQLHSDSLIHILLSRKFARDSML